MFRAADYRLRKTKILSMWNGNIIVLEWRYLHVISNIKYTEYIAKPDQAVYFIFTRGRGGSRAASERHI